jgi:hypothetical protein
MHRICWLLVTLSLLVTAGCWLTPNENHVRVTGTVRHFDLEGGFWAIRGDDSTTYDPMGGLLPEFQQEGLRVRFEGKLRSDIAGFHMVGPIVEITSIQRL